MQLLTNKYFLIGVALGLIAFWFYQNKIAAQQPDDPGIVPGPGTTDLVLQPAPPTTLQLADEGE
jgi:hypothetical protein